MLINCAAYQNGKKLADIPIEQIHLFVSRPDCFVWVALKAEVACELGSLCEPVYLSGQTPCLFPNL